MDKKVQNHDHGMSDSDIEENDQSPGAALTGKDDQFVAAYDYGYYLFSSSNYYFLFDEWMKFSKMPNFDPEKISEAQHLKMVGINRNQLFDFLCGLKDKSEEDSSLLHTFKAINAKNLVDK